MILYIRFPEPPIKLGGFLYIKKQAAADAAACF